MATEKHALILPLPAQGHLNPMMVLSRKLAATGITVTIVSPEFLHRRLRRTMAAQLQKKVAHEEEDPQWDMVELKEECGGNGDGRQSRGGGKAAPIRLMAVPGIFLNVAENKRPDIYDFCKTLMRMTDALTECALRIRPPITCLISDTIMNICTRSVLANHLRVPHVGVWTMSAACYAAHVLIAANPAHFKELMTVDCNVDDNDKNWRPIVGLPGCPALKPTEVISPLQSLDPSEFLFSISADNFCGYAMENSHVLINTFEALEPEALDFLKKQQKWPKFVAIGPILPPEYVSGGRVEERRATFWAEEEGCLEWLGQREEGSVLYVSFGSITVLSDEQASELAAGLEASGCWILMVVRQELVDGQDGALRGSLAKCERVHVVEWAPQLSVLAHPSVAGFFTHCGWNSTTEAVANGVPMLCWPHYGDQMTNSRGLVDYWKIGVELEKDELSGLVKCEEIEAKIKFLMDPTSSSEIRKRARDICVLAKECHASSSQTNLESILQFLLE